MKVLLDTQVWLWMNAAPQRIAEAAMRAIVDPRTTRLLSAASAWEIALKYSLGKLTLPKVPSEYVPERLRDTVTTVLPIQAAHALHVVELPKHHRDPFDRLLIAQAQLEGLKLVSADAQFAAYDLDLLPAAR